MQEENTGTACPHINGIKPFVFTKANINTPTGATFSETLRFQIINICLPNCDSTSVSVHTADTKDHISLHKWPWSVKWCMRCACEATHYEIGEVIVSVSVPVLLLFPVDWEGVVVVLRVPHLWPDGEEFDPWAACKRYFCLFQVSPVRATGPSQEECGRHLPRPSVRTDRRRNKLRLHIKMDDMGAQTSPRSFWWPVSRFKGR